MRLLAIRGRRANGEIRAYGDTPLPVPAVPGRGVLLYALFTAPAHFPESLTAFYVPGRQRGKRRRAE